MNSNDWIFPVLQYRVIDGDSIKVTLDLGFHLTIKQTCRVVGVDTPENSTPAGRAVTAAVDEWMESKLLSTMRCQSFDLGKFRGRFVGEIMHGDERLSAWLTGNGLCARYDGGRRHQWSGFELERIERLAVDAIAMASD